MNSPRVPADPKGGKEECRDLVDSGFLSGEIRSSEEVQQEEEEEDNYQRHQQQQQQQEVDMLKECNVCLDSGLCLTVSFSGLSLGLNDLDKRQPVEAGRIDNDDKAEQEEEEEEEAWRKYYVQDEDGDTYLHITTVCGRLELMESLIRITPHQLFLDTANDDAQTALHLAVETRQHRAARLLVVAGARRTVRDVRGDTPLHIASRNGDVRCVRALLDPVQRVERDGLGLCYDVHTHGRAEAEGELEQWNYDGQTSVHVAASNGRTDVLQQLAWYGADINAREGCGGYTALHMAVQRGDEAMAAVLLSCPKLDVQVLTYGMKSALQLGGDGAPRGAFAGLLDRGCSPYNSEDDDDDDDDESSEDDDDDEMMYDEQPTYIPNLVGANA